MKGCLIRTKGEAGSGNIVEAVRHMKMITSQIIELQDADLSKKQKNLEFL